MIELSPERMAAAAGASIARDGGGGRPSAAAIDSRSMTGGELFFGLAGERVDGGRFAADALGSGAWGAVVEPARAQALVAETEGGWVFAAEDPLAALQAIAREWRRELGCPVVGITGSTGKTSVKDICASLLPFRTHASPENFNTEVGLPLAILAAPPETELLVLEMAMRGLGQIAELCEIAEPDVAAITTIGPVHLELLGELEAIAAAKAEILTGLTPEGRAVIPADEEALEPHLHDDLVTLTFGAGGDVFALERTRRAGNMEATIGTPHGQARFRFPFDQDYNLANAECAIAIGIALDAPLDRMAERAPRISFSRLRGELIELPGDTVLVNDCYNANPISMGAALDHLASMEVSGRRIAVLGGMAELGPDAPEYHREAGARARSLDIDAIVGVGELARDYAPDHWAVDAEAAVDVAKPLIGAGDAILVKGSRSVGLEVFTERLVAELGGGRSG